MSGAIAVVGMACRYPDARTPLELWENVMAQRQAFRRIPAERLSLEDYLSSEDGPADTIYIDEAAVIEGYEFDRARFAVAGATFRSVDLTHWLALDVAEEATRAAGFSGGEGLPHDRTGVLVGNTLTGEFSRAALLRLRWPYVRRVVAAQLESRGWSAAELAEFLADLEPRFKAPFAPPDEETLAGGLSNTIAGRICNHLHVGGGGFTVDGACCSALLAVAQASTALATGDLDVAIAGGVDLSLDPFELVGFSRAGALARGPMRVYDRRSSGFLPGEGCGFVVLMRERDAEAKGVRVHARIRGWGISSDGGGSITRPEAHGQRLALDRCYHRAGYGIQTVPLFEGHGTGTPVGDEVELRTLTEALRAAGPERPRAAIGSIKANIGHTKAAAGMAGLMKTVLALEAQVLPPATGVSQPRPELEGPEARLRVLAEAEPWPAELLLRAGVSSFGFGGINVHLTLDSPRADVRRSLSQGERRLSSSHQDVELFVLEGGDVHALRALVETLAERAPGLSRAELSDLAATLAPRCSGGRWRAALLAGTPRELHEHLRTLQQTLEGEPGTRLEVADGIFLGQGEREPRVAFVFPGQASPVRPDGGAMARRFERVRELYGRVALEPIQDGSAASTASAQPAIVAACLAGLEYLDLLGVRAAVAVGHSLGELVAYHWAEALDHQTLLEVTRTRGHLMNAGPTLAGAMATIAADAQTVRDLLDGLHGVGVACLNAPWQTVVSGTREGVTAAAERARHRGFETALLPAAGGFHSPLMAPAAQDFAEALRRCTFQPLRRRVLSTVTGAFLSSDEDLRAVLQRQLTAPVRFAETVSLLEREADLCIEVGPGHVLTGLLRGSSTLRAFSLDASGSSLRSPLAVAGAAFAAGVPLRLEALFEGRFTRPFDLIRRPRFFASPCECSPAVMAPAADTSIVTALRVPGSDQPAPNGSPLDAVRALIAERAELPIDVVRPEARLHSDYHFSSLAVAELVSAAARRLGVVAPADPLALADASVADVAQALEHLRAAGATARGVEGPPPGVDAWVRCFSVDSYERPRPPRQIRSGAGEWQVVGLLPPTLRDALPGRLTAWPGAGVLVCLPATGAATAGDLLLHGVRRLPPPGAERRFVVVDPEGIAGSFVRTLVMEEPDVIGCVIEPASGEHLLERLEEEVLAAAAFTEVRYDEAGRRWERCLRPLEIDDTSAAPPLRPGAVVLVSGGGRGIAAECARVLARETGAALALFGRSRPEENPELAAHLARLRSESLRFGYESADVNDPESVARAVAAFERALGPVSAVVHAAGVNEPRLLRDMQPADLAATLGPKLDGLNNVLAVVDPERLRLLVTFGSVIGRFGMRGEAHYALANAALTARAARHGEQHPHCRTLCIEWSAWAELGMVERLGRHEGLLREGVVPIPPGEGIAVFRRLLASAVPSTPVVVTGRLGARPPLALEGPRLPFLRFLERPRVHYPGIELVVEADLSHDTDPYLREHVVDGQPLLPAVIGLEAIAQAAQSLEGTDALPCFEAVSFDRAVVVAEGERVTVRLAALRREPGLVDVVLRSANTGFQLDHFRARCRFGPRPMLEPEQPSSLPDLGLEPLRDLYGQLLFQRGRLRRVQSYRELSASGCYADIGAGDDSAWFRADLPGALVLGDAAARDAGLHAVQACVPHARLLPVGVDRLWVGRLAAGESLAVRARERWQRGDLYCYDVHILSPDGSPRESWEGLRLRRTGPLAWQPAPEPLLVPVLEWSLRAAVPEGGTRLALVRHPDRQRGTELAISRALGHSAPVYWRRDGRPEVPGVAAVSAAHAEDLTLAVAGPSPLACDLEFVPDAAEGPWVEVLPAHHLLLARESAHQIGESLAMAGTRVWGALECLRKSGRDAGGPLLLLSAEEGRATFACGPLAVVTLAARLRAHHRTLVMAVLVEATCAHMSTGIALASKRPAWPVTSTSPTT